MTGSDSIRIDKTEAVEAILRSVSAVCLCGMPGIGKKTMLAMLLEKHPQVHPRRCSLEELGRMTSSINRPSDASIWYLVRLPETPLPPQAAEIIGSFLDELGENDRLIFMTHGPVPASLLPLLWENRMEAVYPQTFWFTAAQTQQYLRRQKSAMDSRQVWFLTRGWAGCLALLVRMERQLLDERSAQELCRRYEVQQYIREMILKPLSSREKAMLQTLLPFPRMSAQLAAQLWGGLDEETVERLFSRGILLPIHGKQEWQVHPMICLTGEGRPQPEIWKKAIAWYEEHGCLREALECLDREETRQEYRAFLLRHFQQVPFLAAAPNDEVRWEDTVPQFFYMHWMDILFRQRFFWIQVYQEKAEEYWKAARKSGKNTEAWREVFLNVTYASPLVDTVQWMKWLETLTVPGKPVRLYHMLGESFSFLCGVRDLSDLFACALKEREQYAALWMERLTSDNGMGYRLASLEFDLLLDRRRERQRELTETLAEIGTDSPWQLRLGKLYLLYLLSAQDEPEEARRDMEELAQSLLGEESQSCRFHAFVLYRLAMARKGQKEELLRWMKDSGIDGWWPSARTKMRLATQIMMLLYLGNDIQAGRLLNEWIPYTQRNHFRRFWAEALFQKALTEWERGRFAEAMKGVAESLHAAGPCRYVGIYTGYGKKGTRLLEEYQNWIHGDEKKPMYGKKRYRYGDAAKMPYMEWLDYLIRRSRHSHGRFGASIQDDSSGQAEKLTVTEQMVFQYLEKGYSNAEIGREMNVKLPTVKSHVYNIYKKLGVSSRTRALQKGKEEGIL